MEPLAKKSVRHIPRMMPISAYKYVGTYPAHRNLFASPMLGTILERPTGLPPRGIYSANRGRSRCGMIMTFGVEAV